MIKKRRSFNRFILPKILFAAAVLFSVVHLSVCNPVPAFAAETASEAIIQNARNEAEMLLAIRNGVWLKYTDDWDAYLENRKINPATPEPVFTSVKLGGADGLVAKGYLPNSFPMSNYIITPSGNEISVSTVMDMASANLIPNFLPLAEVSGGEVVFKVTRPGATAGLDFFVDRYTPNQMGDHSTLEWYDGKGLVSVHEVMANTISAQEENGTITVDSPLSVMDSISVDGDVSSTGTGTFNTIKVNVIESNGAASIVINKSLVLGSNGLTTTGAGVFKTIEISDSGNNALKVAGRVTAGNGVFSGNLTAGNFSIGNITSTGNIIAMLVSAGTGNFKEGIFKNLDVENDLTTKRISTKSLVLDGKTGKAGNPYQVYVTNATHAANASRADSATNATNATNADYAAIATTATKATSADLADRAKKSDDSDRLGGRNLNAVIDEASKRAKDSMPVGIPAILVQRTSGSQSFSVAKDTWYKVEVNGSAGVGSVYHSGGDNNGPQVDEASGGKGASYSFYVKAPRAATWSISFYQAPVNNAYRRGGAAVELKESSTTIVCAGGGGGAGAYGRGPGGNAGYGYGARAGSSSPGPTGGAGGAAKSGTRQAYYNGGSGYTRGNPSRTLSAGGGGGSSYLNTGYGQMKVDEVPTLTGSLIPSIKVWRIY